MFGGEHVDAGLQISDMFLLFIFANESLMLYPYFLDCNMRVVLFC